MSRYPALFFALLALLGAACHDHDDDDDSSRLAPSCAPDFFVQHDFARFPGVNEGPGIQEFVVPLGILFLEHQFEETPFPFTGLAVSPSGASFSFNSNTGKSTFPLFEGGDWFFFITPVGGGCVPDPLIVRGTPWDVRLSLERRNFLAGDPNPFRFGIVSNATGQLLPGGAGVSSSFILIFREQDVESLALESLAKVNFNPGETMTSYVPPPQPGQFIAIGVDSQRRLTEAERLKVLDPLGDVGLEFPEVSAALGEHVPFNTRITNRGELVSLTISFRYLGPTDTPGLKPEVFEVMPPTQASAFTGWAAGRHPDLPNVALRGLWEVRVDAEFSTFARPFSTYNLWVE